MNLFAVITITAPALPDQQPASEEHKKGIEEAQFVYEIRLV
jgi:hypothetical protein